MRLQMQNPQLWTRRQWIAGVGALGAHSLIAGASRTKSNIQAGQWIDAHVHVWTPDDRAYPRSGKDRDAKFEPASFTPEELLANCDPSGVGRVVLIQMSFYGYDNSYLLDAIAKYPGKFQGVAIVDPEAPDLFARMKELSRKGIRGFRIVSGKDSNWLDSSAMGKMWGYAAKTSQAICTLVDPEALPSLDRMCSRFPGTTVVVDHLARLGMDGPVRDADAAALCRLARHRHAHVKVSAFYALGRKQYPYTDLSPLIRRVVDAFGPERLMWGSDSPFQEQNGNTYAGSIELVRDRLDFLREQDRVWLLRKTAEKVFFKGS